MFRDIFQKDKVSIPIQDHKTTSRVRSLIVNKEKVAKELIEQSQISVCVRGFVLCERDLTLEMQIGNLPDHS